MGGPGQEVDHRGRRGQFIGLHYLAIINTRCMQVFHYFMVKSPRLPLLTAVSWGASFTFYYGVLLSGIVRGSLDVEPLN